MAQLNSRGTLTRTRWDYFEHSNGVASITGGVSSGQVGAYFANNSSGATAIDLYTINWSATITNTFGVYLLLPPLLLTPLTPTEFHISALAPDVATPPGVVGMFTGTSGQFETFILYSAGSAGTQVSPIAGSYFVTLPPNWAIAITGPSSPNPCVLSMTVWYQYVTDNVAPAP